MSFFLFVLWSVFLFWLGGKTRFSLLVNDGKLQYRYKQANNQTVTKNVFG